MSFATQSSHSCAWAAWSSGICLRFGEQAEGDLEVVEVLGQTKQRSRVSSLAGLDREQRPADAVELGEVLVAGDVHEEALAAAEVVADRAERKALASPGREAVSWMRLSVAHSGPPSANSRRVALISACAAGACARRSASSGVSGAGGRV